MSQFSFEQKIEIVSKMALDYCNENGLKFKQYNQKFAELIVQECMKSVEKTPFGYKDYRSQIEESMRNACVEEIKQHFGVKS